MVFVDYYDDVYHDFVAYIRTSKEENLFLYKICMCVCVVQFWVKFLLLLWKVHLL